MGYPMKTRITLALAWWAFIHAGFLLAGLVDQMNSSLPIPTSEVGRFVSDYSAIYQEEIILYALSPVIWLGLWLTTGKPRILPWKG